MRFFYLMFVILCAAPAWAQRYDFGVNGGISFYNKKTVANPRGDATAGFNTGYAVGFTLGHDMYERISGEIRYSFLQNQMSVESGSTEAKFASQAHAIHYDVLIHTRDRGAPIRPYVAFGGGAKHYRGTGTEQAFQPLSNVAILTKTTDTKGLISVGAGIKAKLTDRMWLRFDVHDYLTPFPTKVIAPASGSTVGGWMHNLVGTGGISIRF